MPLPYSRFSGFLLPSAMRTWPFVRLSRSRPPLPTTPVLWPCTPQLRCAWLFQTKPHLVVSGRFQAFMALLGALPLLDVTLPASTYSRLTITFSVKTFLSFPQQRFLLLSAVEIVLEKGSDQPRPQMNSDTGLLYQSARAATEYTAWVA